MKRKRPSEEETMPLPKRMEKAPASPVKIKQEPVEVEEAAAEVLRETSDTLNGTIELSDEEYDPETNLDGIINNGREDNANNAEEEDNAEDGITLHPDESDLAINSDYEPADNERGESILDEVNPIITKLSLDNRRPFRMTKPREWYSGLKKNPIECNQSQPLFILFYLIYNIYMNVSKPVRADDSLCLYIMY